MSLALVRTQPVLTPPWVKNDLWRRARAVPSLDLQFADNKSLVDATTGQNLVSFTRASSGTYVDSQGVIRTATTNLFTRSEEFGTTWGTLNSSVSADATVAPNGTSTADKIIENSTTNVHGVSRGGGSESLVNGAVYTFSVYAKAGERSFIWMQALNSFAKSYFNLSTGVVSSSGSGHTSTITAIGNGWYRCAITFTSDQTNNSYRAIGMAQTSGTESYAGDNSSGLFLWGAQLEQSSTVGEYIPTTSTINSAPRFDHNPTTGESLGLLVEESRTNLCTYSEAFDDASWIKTSLNGTITANQTTAPDGLNTADLYQEDANTLGRFVGKALSATSGTTYTAVFWAKQAPGSTRYAGIVLPAVSFGVNVIASYTLSGAGSVTIAASGTGTSASIQQFPNGWYRCSLTSQATVTISGNIQFRLSNSAANGAATYAGDGSSGLYIWGAQIEVGAFPTSYIPTTTATVTRSADVASISGSNFGVSRTNLLVRSEDFTTSWITFGSTVTANGAVAPDGTTTADKLINNTANSEHGVYQITTTSGANTFTVFAKQAELRYLVLRRDSSPLIAVYDLQTGTVSQTDAGVTAAIVPFPNGWYRCSMTSTSTGNAVIKLSDVGTGVVYNSAYTGTAGQGIFIWGAQLETGTTATAYIPTTSAAVTVVDSPWYNQSAGTFVSNYAAGNNGARPFFASNIDQQERFEQRVLTTYRQGTVMLAGVGYSEYADTAQSFVAGSAWRHAVSQDGAQLAIGSNNSVNSIAIPRSPAVDRMWIGSFIGTGTFLNGTLRRLTYWPQRLSNNVLQQLCQ